jgi:hypothetical protein
MKLFDIKGEEVVLNAQTLGIPPFKELYERDKTKGKRVAFKEISYVTFLCDNTTDNRYRGYSEGEREKVLKRDFIKDITWEPDELILEAIEKFRELQRTPTSKLYESALFGANKLAGYFQNIDFDALDEEGKPIHSAKELAQNLAAVGNIVRSLKQLEAVVRQEQQDASTARGGSEISEFETSDEAWK